MPSGVRRFVGAPESARLTSRSPEYWVHHMGREKALPAALQLQHDAGLILSNVQVLQQKSDFFRRVAGGPRSAAVSVQRNSTGDASLQSASCGALHDGNGIVAPTSRYGDTNAPAVSRVQCLHVLPGLLPGCAYVTREAK